MDLEKMVFGAARNKSVPYKKLTIRPVMIKSALAFQAEFAYEKKVTHENLSAEEALELCMQSIRCDFKQVNAFTRTEEVQVLAAKVERPRITRRARGGNNKSIVGAKGSNCSAASANCAVSGGPAKLNPQNVLAHNRVKNYIIPDGVPCDFLIELGVMG
ncbi:MAG: hypothetical protein IK059_02955, partial [Firmicutes bacterium]|nr:hypothetical protein [Bacillota bacterium]